MSAAGSVRRLARFTGRELAELRALRAQHGIRHAAAARIRANLDLDGGTGPWVAEAGNQLAQLGPLVPAVGGLEGRVIELQAEIERLRDAPAPPPQPAPVDRTAEEILAMTAFVAALPPQELEVSVVITSLGRPERLRRAIESVLAQTHHRWQLLVAVDSEDRDSHAVAGFEDPRIVVIDRSGLARPAALNLALARATGEVVAYLDDDNAMAPHWLAALAWLFGTDPQPAFVYGALAREHADGGRFPFLQLHDWDPRKLERENLVDQNCLAHRRDLPEARFDEAIAGMYDWELVVRLAGSYTPRRVPLIAAVYRTDAPNRLARRKAPEREAVESEIRRRARRQRPLRVLASNEMFPLVSETYISDELESLVDNGAEVAYFRNARSAAPMPVPRPVYVDFERALAEFEPDVVLMHWATYAAGQLPRLEAARLPFGVRVHSFDHDDELVRRLLAHPQCVGIWSYPTNTYAVEGTHALPPVFTSVRDLPPPAAVRDAVITLSAGLPKKDWPLLFEAFGLLPGVPRHVVTGVTEGHWGMPAELTERAAALDDPPLVQVNLTRRDTLGLLARTSVLVYTLQPQVRFGMPMSIVEGLCAGCCVVLPDRPECRDYAGPGFRGYRTAQDIAEHVREVMRGGPEIEAERKSNMAYGRERFCDPQLGAAFHAQLREGTERFHGAETSASPGVVV